MAYELMKMVKDVRLRLWHMNCRCSPFDFKVPWDCQGGRYINSDDGVRDIVEYLRDEVYRECKSELEFHSR